MVDLEKIEIAVKMILEAVGEDPARDGILETPKRVAKMYQEVFGGSLYNPDDHLKTCFDEEHHEEIILLKDIPFYSMCEHHLLPFSGVAHVAYIPSGKVVGLSKLARVVEGYSRRPQIQERLTNQVAEAVFKCLNAKGSCVVMEASHACMTIRGVKKSGSKMLTSALRGVFKENPASRAEVFSLILRS